EMPRRLLGDLGRLDPRPELLRSDEDVAEELERLGWVVRCELVERDHLDDGREPREVRPDLDTLGVADDQQRRIAEVVLVAEQLDVRRLQVLVVALVLPGEEVTLPDVGEALPSPGLD